MPVKLLRLKVMPGKPDIVPQESSLDMVGPFVAALGHERLGFHGQRYLTLVLSSLTSDPSALNFNMPRLIKNYPYRPVTPEDAIEAIVDADKPKIGVRAYRLYAGALDIFSGVIDSESRKNKQTNQGEHDEIIDFEDLTDVGAEPVDWEKLNKNPFEDAIKLLAIATNLPAAIALPAEERRLRLESEIVGFDRISTRILEKTARFLCAPQRALTSVTIHRLKPGEMPPTKERSPIGRSIQQQFGDALSKHGFYIEVVRKSEKRNVIERIGYSEPSVYVQEV